MKSPENLIFSTISTALRATYNIVPSNVYTDAPAQFPAVMIVEADNSVYQKAISSSGIENAISLMYEVNVYSNKASAIDRKQEVKKIMETVDDEFERIGFVRTMCNPVTNLEDNKIYRMVARYSAVASRDYRIYTK